MLVSHQGFKEGFSARLFVSQDGQAIHYCGNSLLPCRSIQFTVNISASGDTIFIDHAQQRPYKECEHCGLWKSAITVSKPLSFFGLNGRAVIQCHYLCRLFELQGHVLNGLRIFFANLSFVESETAVYNANSSAELIFKIVHSRTTESEFT